jgi:aspartyl protease family protein
MRIKAAAAFAAALGVLSVAMQASGGSTSVELEALLGDTAVLMINGQRKTLRVGQSFAGVMLVAAQPTKATIEFEGRTESVGLSQHVGTKFAQTQEQRVTIPRNAMMQYQTNATINGRTALVTVDTGANVVAISSQQAKAMSIDYSAGDPAQVETASGVNSAYGITLQTVSVGGIQVENVPAMVVEGAYPATILLGMTYLRHVKMQEQNGVLSLSRSH